MRILLALFICLIGTKASAGLLNYQEFEQLTPTQQVMILKAYKEFVSSQNSEELEAKTTSFNFSFITEAYAASNFNCFYAGWPSVKKTISRNGSDKSICSSPSVANPSYKKLSSGCKSSELLCNPTLFGSGICVDVSSQLKRNQAYSQCEQKFSSSGKGLSDVVQEISSSNLSAEADELFEVVNTACTSGFQKNTSMCRNLSSKVAKIREAAPKNTTVAETPAKPELNAEPAQPATPSKAVEVVSEKPKAETQAPIVQSPLPIPPKSEDQVLREAAEQAVNLNETVASAGNVLCLPEKNSLGLRPVLKKDPNVPHITCKPEQTVAPIAMNNEVEQIIKDFNITFHPSKEVVTKTPEFRMFLSELSKYPQNLLREMAASKAEIRLIMGKSVTDDPQWHTECARRVEIAQRFEQYTKKIGMVEEAKKACATTTDGRSWADNFVSGGGGNFSNAKFLVPTRIVINSLYTNPYRKPDGTIGTGHSGSANLFLHEHGHAMDSAKGEHTITESPEWQAVMNDPKVKEYLPKVTTAYESSYAKESFAELFAYYFGCEAARKQVEEQAPAMANFFKNLKSLRQFKKPMSDHSSH